MLTCRPEHMKRYARTWQQRRSDDLVDETRQNRSKELLERVGGGT